MKIPVSWLKEFVDVDLTPEEIAEKLTFSGTEVESIDLVGSAFSGIVVGEVKEVNPHPDADRLSLCKVFNGSETLDVVCGASNYEVGEKVPFIGVGEKLPGGMKIKKARIRGQVSYGMMCSERELELSDSHTGIMLLDRSLEPGTPFSEVMGPPESVLELEVTWNRGDCLSVIGIARELAALTGAELRLPSVDYAETGDPVEQYASVALEDPAGCPRYTARVLTGIGTGPSPAWMQKRLTLCGVRPISCIVDITNYVMLECGQPLHAFDYSLLKDGRIVIRRARAGERIATLDEIDRDISPDMLVIADAERPVAIAGVMGGAGSEIRDETDTVLLESAYFDPALTHRTSVTLGLGTESSHRFERGVDPDAVDWAGARAAALMVELGGATAATGSIDAYPDPREDRKVTCRFERTRSLLGADIGNDEIAGVLDAVGLRVTERDEDSCTVAVPSYRSDIELEADCIEEVARLHGLDSIPVSIPQGTLVPGASDTPTRAMQVCRDALIGLGLSETLNYSFLSESLLDLFFADATADRVLLPNPVSADHGALRNSLIPQMAESLGRNLSRQVAQAALFEAGRVFLKTSDGSICEEDRLAIGLMGGVGRTGGDPRNAVAPEEIFLWMKGLITALAGTLKPGSGEAGSPQGAISFESASRPYFEAESALAVRDGDRVIGVMGLLSADIRRNWRMTGPVAIAELSLEPLLVQVFNAVELSPLPAYPSVTRDMALLVDDAVRHGDIEQIIWDAAPEELTGLKLFDIFKNEGIGEAKKSLAYTLTYRSLEKTLTDEDANGYHEAIKETLRRELNAEIR